MAGIALSSGESWMVSRWIFRRVLEKVEELYPEDKALVEALRVGEANDMLSFTRLDPEIRDRLGKALLKVTSEVGQAAPDAPENDERYVRSIRSLQQLLESEKPATG